MKYFGGKFRLAKSIGYVLNAFREPGQVYVEPFVGAANVLQYLDNPRIASDICEDLILMWMESTQNSWVPPKHISPNTYMELSTSESSALRAFAGFGCSFGGKWFGGYARSTKGKKDRYLRDYAQEAHNSIMRLAPLLSDVDFRHTDYAMLDFPDGSLIYCDPPYSGTTGYEAAGDFDWELFWDIMRIWSKANTVLISEYSAPEDFECIHTFETTVSVNAKGGGLARKDRLFKIK